MASSASNYSAKLLDKYRDVYIGFDDWTLPTIELFKERMGAIGIEVTNVYWSGFASQGDGAMFEGAVVDWGKYLTHLGYDDPILANTAEWYWDYRWKQHGHYYHERSVSYDENVFLPENPYLPGWDVNQASDEDKFRAEVWTATMARHDLLALTEKIQEDLRDHMRDLYRALETEHDHLTSDESIIEYLDANDIEQE